MKENYYTADLFVANDDYANTLQGKLFIHKHTPDGKMYMSIHTFGHPNDHGLPILEPWLVVNASPDKLRSRLQNTSVASKKLSFSQMATWLMGLPHVQQAFLQLEV